MDNTTDNSQSQPGLLGSIINGLTQQAEQSVSSQLPSQQQIIQAYLGAIVVFWLAGGLTLYIVGRALKR